MVRLSLGFTKASALEGRRRKGIDAANYAPFFLPHAGRRQEAEGYVSSSLLTTIAHGGNHASSYNGGNPRNGLAPQDRVVALHTFWEYAPPLYRRLAHMRLKPLFDWWRV